MDYAPLLRMRKKCQSAPPEGSAVIATHVKQGPFDYQAQQDNWFPQLQLDDIDEDIDVDIITTPPPRECPCLIVPLPDEPSFSEDPLLSETSSSLEYHFEPQEPPAKRPNVPEIELTKGHEVDGYRCYYVDKKLAGCYPNPEGCARAVAHQKWTERSKRNHVHYDEVERRVEKLQNEAKSANEASKMAVMNGRRNAAKKQLTNAIGNWRRDRVFHKELRLEHSLIHGRGLYAMERFRKGENVIEYVGEQITMHEADEREISYGKHGISSTYFFSIGDTDQVLDATCTGNWSRYINHSCSPNCSSRVLTNGDRKRIMIYAKREIGPGEELTYDYRMAFEDHKKKIACLCNSKKCRGYMNFDEKEWKQKQKEIKFLNIKKEIITTEEEEPAGMTQLDRSIKQE